MDWSDYFNKIRFGDIRLLFKASLTTLPFYYFLAFKSGEKFLWWKGIMGLLRDDKILLQTILITLLINFLIISRIIYKNFSKTTYDEKFKKDPNNFLTEGEATFKWTTWFGFIYTVYALIIISLFDFALFLIRFLNYLIQSY